MAKPQIIPLHKTSQATVRSLIKALEVSDKHDTADMTTQRNQVGGNSVLLVSAED